MQKHTLGGSIKHTCMERWATLTTPGEQLREAACWELNRQSSDHKKTPTKNHKLGSWCMIHGCQIGFGQPLILAFLYTVPTQWRFICLIHLFSTYLNLVIIKLLNLKK